MADILICEGCAEQKSHPRYCKGCQWAAIRYGYRERHKSPSARRRDAARKAEYINRKQPRGTDHARQEPA